MLTSASSRLSISLSGITGMTGITSGRRCLHSVVLVGAGRMGQIRAPLLRSHAALDLVGLVEPNPEAAAGITADTDVQTVYDSLGEALGDKKVDAVWLATPSFTHEDLITTAAEAGCAIFVEKPVAETVPEIERCFAVADAHNVQLMCGFQRRCDPSYRRVADEVLGGSLGRIHTIRCVFRDHPTPPMSFLLTGGDPFTDLAPHDVDFVRHITGEEPVEVYSIGSAFFPELQEAGVLDSAFMTLKFPSGAVASLEMTRSTTYGYDQRLEVFCDHGMAQVKNVTETNAVFTREQGPVHDRPHYSFPERFRDAYQQEVNQFARVISGDQEPDVTRLDCIQAQRISVAGLKSFQTGRPVALTPYEPSVPDVDPRLSLKFVGFGTFGQPMADLLRDRLPYLISMQDTPFVPSSSSGGGGGGGDGGGGGGGDGSAGTFETEVLESDADAVYICSPDDMHDSQAVSCLNAGKHVFVEMPVMDFGAVKAAATASQKVFWIGFQRRFDAEFKRARSLVQNRLLAGAPVRSVVLESRDPVPAHPDNKYVLYNSVLHDIDMAAWLFRGSKLDVVSATAEAKDNAFDIQLVATHSDGSTSDVSIAFSKNADGYIQRGSVDEEAFGHTMLWDDKLRTDLPWFTLYRHAQEAQFKSFAKITRDADEGTGNPLARSRRLSGYTDTFDLLDKVLAVMEWRD